MNKLSELTLCLCTPIQRMEWEVDKDNNRIPKAYEILTVEHPQGSLCHESFLNFKSIYLSLSKELPIIEFAWKHLDSQKSVLDFANGSGEFGWTDHAATAELNYHVDSNPIFLSDKNFILNYLVAESCYHVEPHYDSIGVGKGIPLKMKL